MGKHCAQVQLLVPVLKCSRQTTIATIFPALPCGRFGTELSRVTEESTSVLLSYHLKPPSRPRPPPAPPHLPRRLVVPPLHVQLAHQRQGVRVPPLGVQSRLGRRGKGCSGRRGQGSARATAVAPVAEVSIAEVSEGVKPQR